ncbi:hypothetical protein TBLA_0A10520 [Henningerozyma blattae CBS 6284]|uniref:TATA-binding protein interacting (TIP20) domain-containing protein n=1 Tax=Henningerozyma blattae (strain ATCC 34711 / CBS 6284 / DSM 70876 / NBRC 10599 / NRRL Y-10934 / UCD 77-7) TaxID=1071380 RepID=I2GXH8_HENB6|nr:hypothetical protein TBLA_0A10520 [Tetrapisispora blattae CBS 6284]CCH58830.1 hypothetical protein TBLA_0A10520 [Tetrapisispora blattae CBS 6284]
MILREGFPIDDNSTELKTLVENLLFPILEKETNIQILDLVTTEVFPKVISKCIASNGKSIGNRRDNSWYDSIIVRPLLQIFFKNSQNFALLQSLCSVLKVTRTCSHFPYLGKDLVGLFLGYIQRDESNSTNLNRMWNDWEILTSLITISYSRKNHKISADVLEGVIELTNKKDNLQNHEKELLIETISHSASHTLSLCFHKLSINQLMVSTEIWYKFSDFVEEMFNSKIIEGLNCILDDSQILFDDILPLLSITNNLSPYFAIDVFNETDQNTKDDTQEVKELTKDASKEDAKKAVNWQTKKLSSKCIGNLLITLYRIFLEVVKKLQMEVESTILSFDSAPSNRNLSNTNEEEDADQQIYLDDLEMEESDEGEMLFEDNIEDANISISLEYNYPILCNILKLIVEILQHIDNSELNPYFIKSNQELCKLFEFEGILQNSTLNVNLLNELERSEEMIPTLKQIESTTDIPLELIQNMDKDSLMEHKFAVLKFIKQQLEQPEVTLDNIQIGLTTIEQLISAVSYSDIHVVLGQWLLPLLKVNKTFVNVLKVGNMKQSIDEGVSVRTMAYTILLQLNLDYQTSCKTLKIVINQGIKDSDNIINETSLKILNNLLSKYYLEIEGLNKEWYNDILLERVKYRVAKWHESLKNRDNMLKDSSLAHRITPQQMQEWKLTDEKMHKFVDIFEVEYPRIE